MKYKFILFSPWLLKSPGTAKELKTATTRHRSADQALAARA